MQVLFKVIIVGCIFQLNLLVSSTSISISCDIDNSECGLSQWNEFSNCIKNALPGDICETPNGNFSNIHVSISNLNGNISHPIIIQSKNAYQTVFDGTINLNSSYYNWKPLSSNKCIFYTNLNNTLIWQLFINNEMQTPARFPNALWKDKSIFNAAVALNNGSNTSMLGYMVDANSNTYQIKSLNYSLLNAIAILNIFSSQTVASIITYHKIGSNSFHYSYPKKWEQSKYYSNTNRFYLEGLFEFMDQQTEFHLDVNSNILYSYSENCKNLNEIHSIRGKTQSHGFYMTDSSFVNVSNIIFFATGFDILQSQFITLDNIIFSYSSFSKRILGNAITNGPIPSYATNVDNFRVINSTFVGSDSVNIEYNGQDGYFLNNLFEYTSYSCINPTNSPGPLSGSLSGSNRTIFTQNTIINYGPQMGYKAGNRSIASLNYFANQSNLQHDGAQIQVPPSYQNGTQLIRNWSFNTLKYGYRFDGCSEAHHCGYNCTIKYCVSFNDASIMIKGDNHTVLNNIGFNATFYNGYNDIIKPAMCIRHAAYNYSNIHTITRNNGADEFAIEINGTDSNGCLYPIVGYAYNNIQGPVAQQLVNPNEFDFRPKPGSEYALNGVGAYLVNDSYYWIPGRQKDKASFPIPKNGGVLKYRCYEKEKYIELIWKFGYKSLFHIGRIYSHKHTLLAQKEFFGEKNIWRLEGANLKDGFYYWSIDAVVGKDLVHNGTIWTFYLTDECLQDH
eukprot:362792_1